MAGKIGCTVSGFIMYTVGLVQINLVTVIAIERLIMNIHILYFQITKFVNLIKMNLFSFLNEEINLNQKIE